MTANTRVSAGLGGSAGAGDVASERCSAAASNDVVAPPCNSRVPVERGEGNLAYGADVDVRLAL